MSEQIGKRIGDYEILGVLGAGGMGQVFKVRNVISDRVEAMKILLPDLAGRQDLANRFLREIKVLAGLNHPNIAYLRTALTLDNQLVMIMEYVEGVTLAARLEQGSLSVPDALNYIGQVLDALSYAHKQGVVHRDIKPANMMLTPQGVIKLMDFGIARSGTDRTLTATGTTLGSLHYMSPEQVKGANTDARSDLYSVGISLYEMVTGQPPFHADSDYSLMAAQLQEQPKPPIELCPNLPAALDDIILTAMQKDPGNRFQTADAFRNAVNNVASTLPKDAVAATLPKTTPVASAPTELYRGTLPTASTPKIVVPSVQPAAAQPTPLPTASAPSMTAQPASPQASSQPTAAPSVSPQPPSVLGMTPPRSSHRGLYMSLGALIVVAVLAAAGLYIPRHSSTRAHENDQPQPAVSQPAQSLPSGSSASEQKPTDNAGSASMPATQSPMVTAPQGTNSSDTSGATATSVPTPAPNMGSKSKHAKSVTSAAASGVDNSPQSSSVTPDAQSGGQPAQASNAAQLEELEQEIDQLSSRATSVSDSLDSLKRQQSAQGLGLRGDISSTQELMKTNIARAQAAMQNQDARNAKKYLDLAQPQVETLEKFLGR